MDNNNNNNNNNNREKKRQRVTKTVDGDKRLIKKIKNDGDKKRSWSDLPYDILESIKKKLYFINQVNFRAVCKSWSCAERVPSLQQIPWLLVFDNNEDSSWNRKEKDVVYSCKLVDPKNKKTYTIDANVIKAKLKIRDFNAMKVHESKYGWLLISSKFYQHDGSTLFFYSPFFSEEYNFIELPVLKCNIYWATFTSNPLDKDCTVVTLNMNFYDNSFLIYTHRRGQGSWSSQSFLRNGTMLIFYSWSLSQKWMYSEGNFYFVSYDGRTMGKFDMVLGEWNVFPVLSLIGLEEANSLPGSLEMRRGSLSKLHHYIVKSSNRSELFLISDSNLTQSKYDSWGYDSNSNRRKYDSWRYSKSHHIHRIDLSSMIWEDLDSIGDHVLFFGDGYNSVLNSSVLKSNGERKDISDKIYYCKDNELKYRSVHDYTLKTNQKPYRKQNCSRHYGSIATKNCRKMLIDPPPL